MKEKCDNTKLTHEIYLQRIHEKGIPLEPLEQYVNSQTPIRHRCTKCGSVKTIRPNSVMAYSKKGITLCQECGGKSLRVGKNDLWTTHPSIAKLLVDPEEGYLNTSHSNKKVDWYCPICGTKILKKAIHNTVHHALVCPLCSNGRSKGHKIVNAILDHCGIEYENECEFKWSDGKRYDIFTNKNCIIEVNGQQHYDDCYLLKLSNKTLGDQIKNDEYKKDLALRNGIHHYIYVDGKISDCNYIIDKIKENTSFREFIDKFGNVQFNDIDWKRVLMSYSDPLIWRILDLYESKMMIKDICANLKCSNTTVERYLHLLRDYGFCNYDGYSQLCKKVICTTTGEHFDSLTEAANKYGIKPLGIYRVCNNLYNRTTAGRLPDGTRLKWQYAP